MKIGKATKPQAPPPAPELDVDEDYVEGLEEPSDAEEAVEDDSQGKAELDIDDNEEEEQEPNLDVAAPATPAKVADASAFLMRGSLAKTAVQTEQAKAELAMSNSGYRFWIVVGAEARISFIDGNLDEDGALDAPFWYEHRLMIGGKVQSIVCYETAMTMGPCPICAAGHRTQLVAGLTVINHTPYTIQSGQNAGKTLVNRVQMFVAPRTAMETLQKLATKRKGLAGHCYDVYRKDKKDPRVGSVYDYHGKLTAKQIASFGDDWMPCNWEEALKLLPPEEMKKFGEIAVPFGAGPSSANAAAADIDL